MVMCIVRANDAAHQPSWHPALPFHEPTWRKYIQANGGGKLSPKKMICRISSAAHIFTITCEVKLYFEGVQSQPEAKFYYFRWIKTFTDLHFSFSRPVRCTCELWGFYSPIRDLPLIHDFQVVLIENICTEAALRYSVLKLKGVRLPVLLCIRKFNQKVFKTFLVEFLPFWGRMGMYSIV